MGFIIELIKIKLISFFLSLRGLLFFLNIFVKIGEYWDKVKAKYNNPRGFKKVALFFGLVMYWIFKLGWLLIKLLGKPLRLVLRKSLKKEKNTES